MKRGAELSLSTGAEFSQMGEVAGQILEGGSGRRCGTGPGWLLGLWQFGYFHLSVLMSEGRMEREVDGQMLYWSVAVKSELSWRVNQEELGSNL